MIGSMKWVALYSHTGKEIVALAQHLGMFPEIIISNGNLSRRHPDVEHITRKHIQAKLSTAQDYRDAIGKPENTIVTLHGWMRIVPPEICNEYEIYNGHPALINVYPELKGADQQKAIVSKQDVYPIAGSVIHRVTPGLDEGEILTSCSTKNTANSAPEAFALLRTTSFKTWVVFLKHMELYQEPSRLPPEVVI